MQDSLNLSEVTNVSQLMDRTPNGAEVLRLVQRLGLITPSAEHARRPFSASVSDLNPAQLSNEQSYWAGEYGRIVELLGLLNGQERYLSLKSKEVRARERSRLRRNAEANGTKKIAAQIADEAEESAAVRDIDEEGAVVTVLLSSATASKEAVAMYLTSLSREISFRCSQMDARLYG